MFTFPLNRSTFSFTIFVLAIFEVIFWIHATGSPVSDIVLPTQNSQNSRILNQRAILLPEQSDMNLDAGTEYIDSIKEEQFHLRVLNQDVDGDVDLGTDHESEPIVIVSNFGQKEDLTDSDEDADGKLSPLRVLLFGTLCVLGFMVTVFTLVSRLFFPKPDPDTRSLCDISDYSANSNVAVAYVDLDDDVFDLEANLQGAKTQGLIESVPDADANSVAPIDSA